ncbi:hypothetical protein ES702_04449 [subsurface metagenome]
MATAEPKILNFSSGNSNSPQKTFEQFLVHQKLGTKYIPELMLKLHEIYGDDCQIHVKRTFENLISCQAHQNFNFYVCEWCGNNIYHRIPCTSFFCDRCRTKLAARLKEKLLTYIWDIPHRFSVFTLPPEIQDLCQGWTSYILKRNKKQAIKFHLATDLIYKSVGETVKEYFSNKGLEVGFIMYPHTESTYDLSWFFHLNVLISTRGLRKSSKFTNFNKETNKRIFPNHQAIYQTVNTSYIDYDEIKKIYLKNLSKNFKVKIMSREGNPIHFEGKLYPKQISKNLFGYVRKLLFRSKHIEKSTTSSITLRRWNTTNERYESFDLSWENFYKRCIQHIPPKFTRTIRIYGLYSHANKKRYFLTPVIETIEKKIKCRVCGSNGRLMYSVSRGQFIKIDEIYFLMNLKKILCMLDMKDFDFLDHYSLKDGFYVIKAKKDRSRIGLECPIELYPINFTNEDDFGIERYKRDMEENYITF